MVTAMLSHVGGHKRTATIPVALDSSGGKNAIQSMGSSFSYGKRYTATALLNIVSESEDDDGVRGGTRFITEAQADELRELCKRAGRQEGPILQRLFVGEVRSFDEVEAGGAHLAVRSTLEGIIHQQAKKAGEP